MPTLPGPTVINAAAGSSIPDHIGETPDFPVAFAPVRLAFVQLSGSLAGSYNNGTLGVGATWTRGVNEALVIDGVAPSVGDRMVFIHYDKSQAWGVYTVTNVGADDPGGAPWVITRATDADTTAEFCQYWTCDVQEGVQLVDATVSVSYVDSSGLIGTSGIVGWQVQSGRSVAFGYQAAVADAGQQSDSIAIGSRAWAIAPDALAIGNQAKANFGGSIAVGESAISDQAQAAAFGHGATSDQPGITVVDGPNGVRIPNLAFILPTADPLIVGAAWNNTGVFAFSAGGAIINTTINNDGSGYAANDTGTFDAGGADATYIVDSVDGTGAVTAWTVTAGGTAYSNWEPSSTTPGGGQPGVGTGFSVFVQTV